MITAYRDWSTVPHVQPGERLRRRVSLTRESIAEFAERAGDLNPIHADREFAASTRFGGVLTSGGQITALFLGLVATHFSRATQMIGLEFGFRFRFPVHAPQDVTLEWLVTRVRDSERLGGQIVELRGRLITQDNSTATEARGKILVSDAL